MIKLFESFKSQKDIEKLADILLNIISENIIRRINDKTPIDWNKIIPTAFFKIKNVPFYEIGNFVRNTGNLFIKFEPFGENHISGVKAIYKVTKQKGYQDSNEIIIYADDLVDIINNYISDWNGEIDYKNYTYSSEDYYTSYNRMKERITSLIHGYKTHLIHELQHAYDDYRSNSKYVKNIDKGYDTGLIEDFIKNYLNLKHEVDARFSQAIYATTFYELDWDNSEKFNLKFEYNTIRPFDEVFKDFKRLLKGYDKLTNEELRRVNRKFGQFYEMEKEFIKDMNIQNIKQLDDYKNYSKKQIEKLIEKDTF